MKCKRWETPLSNCGRLCFRRLVDQELLLFEVKDEHGTLYEVILKSDTDYSYLIRDEAYTTHDVNLRETGWTYIVEDGGFISLMSVMVEHAQYLGDKPYVHYVVSTDDSCLELLSIDPPIVRKVR